MWSGWCCKCAHHSLLHGAEKVFPSKAKQTKREPAVTDNGEKMSGGSQNHSATTGSVCSVVRLNGVLPSIQVVARSGCRSEKTLALCDSGSSHSWISQSLANQLRLSGTPHTIGLNAFTESSEIRTENVELEVCSLVDSAGRFKVQALTKDQIDVGREELDITTLKSKYSNLSDLPETKLSYADVQIILG